MNKQDILNKTIKNLSELPSDKIQEINNFVDFLKWKNENEFLNEGIIKLAEESNSYDFLKNEDDIYTINDLKVNYGKG